MKTIKDLDIENKRVIIRVDYNVPIKDGIIKDDNRIKESLDTIKYCLKRNCKVILLSHLGRVKEESDLEKNNLYPVSVRLSELLGKDVLFIDQTRGPKVEDLINHMNYGDVCLLQNTRYEDLDSEKESKNDPELGKYWASLGDVMINDAFGTSHRAHASNCGIMSNLESGIGFLIEKEYKYIKPVLESPKKPYTLILGGSKVSDKIGLIENLIDKVDYILIGGGMAYTFLKAKDIEIGNSLLDSDNLDYCKNLLNKYPEKIILPIDHVVSESTESTNTKVVDSIEPGFMGLDIGPKTIKLFETYLNKTKTLVWNGPVGMFENELYSKGTKGLCEIISKLKIYSIVGGGDTASAVINMGYKDKFSHISTGGGASLELLEGKEMPFEKYVK